MKKWNILFGAILLTGFNSCTREFSARSKSSGALTQLAAPSPSIPLDDTYALYYRAVDVEDIAIGGHPEKRLVPHGRGNSTARLVEIEYLFVPPHDGKVVYISTAADRLENRYSSSAFLGLDHPNAADFRVFLIGDALSHDKIRFHFKDGKQTDNWTIEKNAKELRLIRIEQMRGDEFEDVFEIKDALYSHLDFIRQPKWTICYLPAGQPTATAAQPLTGMGISYIKNGGKYEMQMQFSQTLVTWKDKYVIYKPD